MSEGVLVAAPPAEAAPVARRGLVRRLLRDPVAVGALVFLAAVVLVAVFAPLLTSTDPTATHLSDTLAPPFTGAHPLGGDGVGRDVLAELLYGARTSLLSGLIVVAVAMVVGVSAGLLAGYFRGWFDSVNSWISNALMALPAIVVLLVVLARVGRSTTLAMVVFGLLIAPAAFRLVRSSVIAVREELYVDDGRIMRRHILPVVIAPSIIQASQLAGVGIGIEAGIAFLGLGSSDRASWGLMLNDASQNIYAAPRLLLWPSLAIVLTIMAFSLLGSGLRDALGANSAAPARRKPVAFTGPAPEAGAGPVAEVSTDALLVLDGLRVSYPAADGGESVVVDGVSLSVRKGEVLGLVGESGSGKSQTAFSILGLLPPEASTTATALVFDGQDLPRLSAADRNKLRGRRIGYIPQEPMSNLDPSFRIGSQLTEPMRHHRGLSRAEAKAEALRLLARVGIADPERVFASYPHEVSGGMAQRVLIAGAVSCDPDLLIADEPTTALDVTVQAEVLDLIRDLQAERGMGVLLVTHNFGVVADLCDTVAVMRSGRIVESAPAAQLFADPQHEYTRMLLAATLEDAPPRAQLTVAPLTDSPRPVPQQGAPS